MQQTLDLMVQRAYWVMNNDVLISVPLFVFMGYLVERANLIQALFKSLHLATTRIPGSLAVATIVTCAIFATAIRHHRRRGDADGSACLSGDAQSRIQHPAGGGGRDRGRHPRHPDPAVGASDPLRRHRRCVGDAALRRRILPRHHAGGTLRRLRHRLAKLKPSVAPPLSEEDRYVPLPKFAEVITKSGSNNVLVGLIGAIKGKRNADVPMPTLLRHLFIALLPLLAAALLMGSIYLFVTAPKVVDTTGLQEMGSVDTTDIVETEIGGLQEPEEEGGLQEPPAEGLQEPEEAGGLQEPPAEGSQETPVTAGSRGRNSATVCRDSYAIPGSACAGCCGCACRAPARPDKLLDRSGHLPCWTCGFLCDIQLCST